MLKNNSHGFSLVEIMITVGILAIVFLGITQFTGLTVKESSNVEISKNINEIFSLIRLFSSKSCKENFNLTTLNEAVSKETLTVKNQSNMLAKIPKSNFYLSNKKLLDTNGTIKVHRAFVGLNNNGINLDLHVIYIKSVNNEIVACSNHPFL